MACMSPAGDEDTMKTMVTSVVYNCFTDTTSGGGNQSIQPQAVNQFHQSFEFNPEMYGLTSGMEILGFPQKNMQQVITTHHHHHHQDNSSVMWKEFFGKSVASASTSKAINDQDQFYHNQDFMKTDFSPSGHHHHDNDDSATWHHDNRVILDQDPMAIMRSSCVFPCEGNERPSQGLSLSLGGSDHPSRIGLQSFELRQPDDIRDGYFGKSSMNIQQQQQQQMMGKVGNLHFHQNQFQIRSSMYLAPAQELLNEFCNLGTKQMNDSYTPRLKNHKTNHQLEDTEDAANSSNTRIQSLYSIDLLELQKRKARLLQMLEEVDRRYKHYCDQMKAVVSSFEAVAGNGTATVYSSLASKAMSRHFRSLRDGIIGEIKATKKALGEKDTVIAGGTRGETPRLRVLDQALRLQRVFQQMDVTHPWRPQRGLPERAVSVLRAWLFEHFLHPYPSEVDKHILARQTRLSRSQVSNWFINARVRLWKPMVEEMYLEETKEQENMGPTTDTTDKNGAADVGWQNQYPPSSKMDEDQKPTHEQLVRIDSECLSSIIHNNPEKVSVEGAGAGAGDNNDEEHDHDHQQIILHQNINTFGRVMTDTFGAVEVDFSSSYNHPYGDVSGCGITGGGGVSLTLGLPQHHDGGSGGSGSDGGGGLSLAFSPTNQNSPLYYTREHIEMSPPVHYSSLFDSETQNLPYKNLMGAQLLHDLAG